MISKKKYEKIVWGSDVPSDIEEAAVSTLPTTIPAESKAKYDLAYEKFTQWCEEKEIKHVNEQVMLTYFDEKKAFKASTLWTIYSMLRSELALNKSIDISKYANLVAFLKKQSKGYNAKKSKVLTKENIAKFLSEADDYSFLLAKVSKKDGGLTT